MPMRLDPQRGEVIDRERSFTFGWNGRPFPAYSGDTIASALSAGGVRVFSRSFKYHRPRGLLTASYLDPGCLLQVGDEPNVRGAHRLVEAGMDVRSQDTWPSLSFDVKAANELARRALPAGFYYKTFMSPGWLWPTYERVLERFAHGGEPARDVDDDQRMDNAQAPVGNLQTSIRFRLDELFEGLDGDIEADCAELLESFLRRAADEIDRVTDALAVNDAELVRQCAHSLKGMAANVGVTTVAMLAAEVEDAARDGHLHAIGPAGDGLRVALEGATRNIHAMLPSLAARA